MKHYFSKDIQNVISLRPVVAGRTLGPNGKPLDHPIVLIYFSDGRLFDIMSISWVKHMAISRPSYFKGLYSELRFFF